MAQLFCISWWRKCVFWVAVVYGRMKLQFVIEGSLLLNLTLNCLTHWGRVTHICVSELTIIGSDNGLSPGRHQAIISTNEGILWIGPLGTNFSEIVFGIQTFSFNRMHLKMSSAKWRPFCLGLSVLTKHSPWLDIWFKWWPRNVPSKSGLHHTLLYWCSILIHWGQNKMVAPFKTTFSNAFSIFFLEWKCLNFD